MSINDKTKGNTHIPLFLVFTALTAQTTILLNVLLYKVSPSKQTLDATFFKLGFVLL